MQPGGAGGVGSAQALSVLLLSCFPPQVSVSLLCKLAANTEVLNRLTSNTKRHKSSIRLSMDSPEASRSEAG